MKRIARLLPSAAMLLALLLAPVPALARGYTPQGRCGAFARLDIPSPKGTCVALLADEAEGLRAPRRVLEVAPGRYWIVDMGSWEPRQGKLFEMTLPTDGPLPRRARLTQLAAQLDRPLGLVVGPDGKAYIGEAGTVWRTPIPTPGAPVQRETVLDKLPADGRHPVKELAFGPRDAATGEVPLFVNVGSSSDACRDEAGQYPVPCPDRVGDTPRAAVYQATLAGPALALKSFRPFAIGLRNSLALAVLQQGSAKGALLQGENSIDYASPTQPSEKLNVLKAGGDYGWPYCVANRQTAQHYEKRFDCTRTEAPLMAWPAHAAPLQMVLGPAGSPYANQLLVAWHGPQPSGHRLVGFQLDGEGLPAGKPIDWLAGWDAKAGVRPMGRPTGLTVDGKGRLLVVEDFNRTVLMVLPLSSAAAALPPQK